jgi:hypothetical protein
MTNPYAYGLISWPWLYHPLYIPCRQRRQYDMFANAIPIRHRFRQQTVAQMSGRE